MSWRQDTYLPSVHVKHPMAARNMSRWKAVKVATVIGVITLCSLILDLPKKVVEMSETVFERGSKCSVKVILGKSQQISVLPPIPPKNSRELVWTATYVAHNTGRHDASITRIESEFEPNGITSSDLGVQNAPLQIEEEPDQLNAITCYPTLADARGGTNPALLQQLPLTIKPGQKVYFSIVKSVRLVLDHRPVHSDEPAVLYRFAAASLKVDAEENVRAKRARCSYKTKITFARELPVESLQEGVAIIIGADQRALPKVAAERVFAYLEENGFSIETVSADNNHLHCFRFKNTEESIIGEMYGERSWLSEITILVNPKRFKTKARSEAALTEYASALAEMVAIIAQTNPPDRPSFVKMIEKALDKKHAAGLEHRVVETRRFDGKRCDVAILEMMAVLLTLSHDE